MHRPSLASSFLVVLAVSLSSCGETPIAPEAAPEEPVSAQEPVSAPEPESGSGSGGEQGESGTQYALSETARETRSGVSLVMGYDAAAESFAGTVTNTTAAPVANVRVEVHLSNGVELGPSPTITLNPAQVGPVTLDADGQSFTTWSVHVELGTGEH